MSKDATKRRQRNQEYRTALAGKAASDEKAAKLLAKRERDAKAKRDKRAAAKVVHSAKATSISDEQLAAAVSAAPFEKDQ